jgi:hypothetical protein
MWLTRVVEARVPMWILETLDSRMRASVIEFLAVIGILGAVKSGNGARIPNTLATIPVAKTFDPTREGPTTAGTRPMRNVSTKTIFFIYIYLF